MDPGKGGRFTKGLLLPRGLYPAQWAEPVMSIQTKIGVQPFVQNSLEYHWRFWCQPQVLGCQDGNDCHPAHLGAEPLVAPTPALHCSRGRYYQIWQMEPHQKQGKVLVSCKGDEQGV